MALQFKNLITLEQDMAGKWRATIDINDETIMLKFQSRPTLQDVKDEVKRVIDTRAAMRIGEIETINKDIVRLQLRKADLEAIK